MATLTFTVGAVTATKTTSNAVAAAIVDDYIAAYNGPVNGTNQQKADWFINDIARHIREVANGRAVRASREAAEAAAAATANTRDWT